MKHKLILLLLPLLLAGCVQNIRTAELEDREIIPSVTYESFFFVAGDSERLRAVLLKHPDAKVDIVPAAEEITTTTSTYPEAMYFMKEKRGMRSIITQKVFYKDTFLGYLLTYEEDRFNKLSGMKISLYEKNGKIYFSGREIIRVDD